MENTGISEHLNSPFVVGGKRFLSAVEEHFRRRLKNNLGDPVSYGVIVFIVPQMGYETGKVKWIYTGPVEFCEGLDRRKLALGLAKGIPLNKSLGSFLNNLQLNKKFSVSEISINKFFNKNIGCALTISNKTLTEEDLSLVDRISTSLARRIYVAKSSFYFDLICAPGNNQFRNGVKSQKHITDNCKLCIGSSDISVWLGEKNGKLMERQYSTREINAHTTYGKGIAGTCALKQEVISIDDLLDSAEVLKYVPSGLEHKKIVELMGWRSAAFIPLTVHHDKAGVFAIYSKRVAGINNLDISIASAFAKDIEYVLAAEELHSFVESKEIVTRAAPIVDATMEAIGALHDARDEIDTAKNLLTLIRDGLSKDFETLDKVIASARQLIEKLQDEIKFSRQDKVRLRNKNLSKELEMTFQIAQANALSKGIKLTKNCPADLIFLVDISKLRRAIRNLLENSIDFLENFDSAGIDKAIYISIKIKDDTLLLEVSDNGPGIPSDIKGKVTELFITSREVGGYGIGLYNVKKYIVDAHNGSLEIDSRDYRSVGRKKSGTTIVLGIPNNDE